MHFPCCVTCVTVNNSLSGNDHIKTVIKNIAINISIVYHDSNYISQLTIVNAFITYIFSLIFILFVLSGGKTSNLQKRAARVILDCDFYTPSSTMFSGLKWMSYYE